MGRIYCIGEALIDFIPEEKGCGLKDVTTFHRRAGGAPANVAVMAAKLGAKSRMICKLGDDAFGHFLADTLNSFGVDGSSVVFTKEAPTAIAFVSLDQNGDRDFIFYRSPSADMLLVPEEVHGDCFREGDILHFGSVDLAAEPVRSAHRKAIRAMKDAGGLISFDPNVRLPLFPDEDACRNAVLDFLPGVDILKLSDEEMNFLFHTQNVNLCYQEIQPMGIKVLIVTKGEAGAELVCKTGVFSVPALHVATVDTTGAGDAFVGAALSYLQQRGGLDSLCELGFAQHLLKYGCAAGSLATTQMGAMDSFPSKEKLEEFLSHS